MAVFSVAALLLGAVGIYGLTGYDVARRTREIGLRMALGADRMSVLALMVRQGAGLALVGVILGMTIAIAASRLVGNLLFGITAHDPLVLVATPLVLLAVAVMAAFVPARRAAAVDPLEAIRVD
jgi:putative ABC transport system permease protein